MDAPLCVQGRCSCLPGANLANLFAQAAQEAPLDARHTGLRRGEKTYGAGGQACSSLGPAQD